MPQLFKIGSYVIYFWINENDPLEPVHVHITKVRPSANATKIWITRSGKCLLQNNNMSCLRPPAGGLYSYAYFRLLPGR